MYRKLHVSVVIPVLNEEAAIGSVIDGLKCLKNQEGGMLIDDIVVCDNDSSDRSASIAIQHGARVVLQSQKGYGIACQTAIRHLKKTDIVLFVDGDLSCVPCQALDLIRPIAEQSADLVIGSRALGNMESGALTTTQRFGNWLAVTLIRWLWQKTATDLGPFRAIRFSALQMISMQDKAFGWTVEMQVKAIQQGLMTIELPVDSIRRVGKSKISGTIRGAFFAGVGILGTIAKLYWQQRSIMPAYSTSIEKK